MNKIVLLVLRRQRYKFCILLNAYLLLIFSKIPFPTTRKVNLGIMAMQEYPIETRTLELGPHHQIQLSVKPRTPLFGGLTPLQEIQSIYCKYCQQGELLLQFHSNKLLSVLSAKGPYYLVLFYGISTIVDYLMPNQVYTYILDIWFLNTYCK